MNEIILSLRLSLTGREFTGVAYSGTTLSYGDSTIGIDISSIQKLDKQVPILLEHDPQTPIGFGKLRAQEGKLIIDGTLLDNKSIAQEIIADAETGKEWQLSVFVESDRISERKSGDMLNGQAIEQDNVLVFENALIREVSFCTLGVDGNTYVSLLSLNHKPDDTLKVAEQNADEQDEQNAEYERVCAELSAARAEAEQLKKQLNDQAQSARLSRLKALGIADVAAAQLAVIEGETFEVMLEQFVLQQKQTAALSINAYPTPTPERENPIKWSK